MTSMTDKKTLKKLQSNLVTTTATTIATKITTSTATSSFPLGIGGWAILIGVPKPPTIKALFCKEKKLSYTEVQFNVCVKIHNTD